jgi:hypothetical protein
VKAFITSDMWEILSRSLIISKSTEADEFLGDIANEIPPGGNAEGDDEGGFGNEQDNDIDFGSDDMGGGFGDDFGGADSSMGGMAGGGNGGGLGTNLKPTNNPFKGQNGRDVLDSKLAELYNSVENSLELVQLNTKVDKVVITELSILLDNIKRVREVVFIQPIESSLYRWALCVRTYELISKSLYQDIKQKKKEHLKN